MSNSMPKRTQHAKGRARAGANASRVFEGIIDVTRRGVGYFEIPGFAEDIEIAPENLNCALNADMVRVRLLAGKTSAPGSRKIRTQGRVEAVLERAKTHFVGVVRRDDGHLFLHPDDRRMYAPIALEDSGVREGDKVHVELLQWSDPRKHPRGKLIEVLGRAGEHETEMRALVVAQGFETAFPAPVEREAEVIAANKGAEIARAAVGRRDFRSVPTFTIDPADAKDFDDAISVREIGEGRVEVGVHIADVSHYLKVGSAMDTEARKRATSIYLVDRTIPMLPEALSNDVCSLVPNEDRLTFSAVFVLDRKGTVLERWFGETVIHSQKRFTYEEAQEVLDRGAGVLLKELVLIRDLARIMREERQKEGALEFESDEVKFELDEKGKPIRVYLKKRVETNLLIEDWMLLANREVAEYMHELGKRLPESERTFIYRIHDVPKQEKLEELGVFLRAIGFELDTKKRVSGKEINRMLADIKGTPQEAIIRIATMRSMAKAIYATRNIGHFGLSFRFYTHFTSPIRRYPDVMVHRILRGHLHGEKLSKQELAAYETLAIRSSEREVAAQEAERDSIKMKQVEFLADRVGDVFDATVSGVADWGMYVSEDESKADGLIRLRDLTDDYYTVDSKNYRIIGEKKKRIFSIGDRVRVQLRSVNLEERQLDFVLAK